MKRQTSASVLILMVLCPLTVLGCSTPMVNASFHISPDGNVSGTDKISRNGNVYTFTDNIYRDLKVEKSNIIIDGTGFKLEKREPSGNWGITFSSDVHDVTIKNLVIIGFDRGVILTGSGNTVTECTIINCYTGILLHGANDNDITDNKLVNSTLRFDDSSNNRLRNNRFENSWIGTSWQNSYNDVDSSNTVDGKPVYYLVNQQDLVISPIHYPEIGCLILIGCTGVTIRDIVFPRQKTNGGVTMTFTSGSKIINNTFIDLWKGITIHECSDIVLSGNYIGNNEVGVTIHPRSPRINITGNHIENNDLGISPGMADLNVYHNNFINNTQHVDDDLWHPLNFAKAITYVWDDGKEGNYWSDNNATDADNNGVADTPYIINKRGNNADRYPLMQPVQIDFKVPVEPEPTPSSTPLPTTFIAVASIAIIVITTLAIIYLKKRKQ